MFNHRAGSGCSYQWYWMCCSPGARLPINVPSCLKSCFCDRFPSALCPVFSPPPPSPLRPCCTNSSLLDTIEQRRHLTLAAPPSLFQDNEVLGASLALAHTLTIWFCCHRRESPPPPRTPAHQRRRQAHSLLHCVCTVRRCEGGYSEQGDLKHSCCMT